MSEPLLQDNINQAYFLHLVQSLAYLGTNQLWSCRVLRGTAKGPGWRPGNNLAVHVKQSVQGWIHSFVLWTPYSLYQIFKKNSGRLLLINSDTQWECSTRYASSLDSMVQVWRPWRSQPYNGQRIWYRRCRHLAWCYSTNYCLYSNTEG